MGKSLNKEIRYFYQGEIGSLHYCIVEHSRFDPFSLVKSIVKDSGVIILGLDSYKIKGKKLDFFLKSFIEEGIDARLQSGNLWIDKEDSAKYYRGEYSILEGNEYIFTETPPKVEISLSDSPLKGWKQTKLKENVIRTLEQILVANDLYAYDDFMDCLFVSKEASIIDAIAREVNSIINTFQ